MELFQINVGDGPLIASAIHSGHAMRPEVAAMTALDERQRLREEDPHTNILADVAPTQIIGHRSRFEVDLNRPRSESIYITPEQAWGLDVWREPLTPPVVARSRGIHDLFYGTVRGLLQQKVELHGRVLLLDIHSYNHRRDGSDGPVAPESSNPEINIGTGSMDRKRWGPVVEALIDGLRSCDALGRQLDVRENVKFQGGHFVRWIHGEFPQSVCAPAVEFKKTFMNEWTSDVDHVHLIKLRDALRAIVPRLLELLEH